MSRSTWDRLLGAVIFLGRRVRLDAICISGELQQGASDLAIDRGNAGAGPVRHRTYTLTRWPFDF